MSPSSDMAISNAKIAEWVRGPASNGPEVQDGERGGGGGLGEEVEAVHAGVHSVGDHEVADGHDPCAGGDHDPPTAAAATPPRRLTPMTTVSDRMVKRMLTDPLLARFRQSWRCSSVVGLGEVAVGQVGVGQLAHLLVETPIEGEEPADDRQHE